MVPREGEPSVVSLELKPVPYPVVGWIWVGATLSLVALALPASLAQPSNSFAWVLVFIGLALIQTLNPPFRGRTPRGLRLDHAVVRIRDGTRFTKYLQRHRVWELEHVALA